MKKAEKLLAAAASRLDLPGNVVAGLPVMELTGFSQLSVEHHCGIREYTDEAVTVALKNGSVRITGRRLAISLLNHDYVVVRGELENIQLQGGDGHG